jgi:prevent-host-death family protein
LKTAGNNRIQTTSGGKKMTPSVNIHKAKTHFSKLLTRVQSGEEIVIAKAGRPIAKLIPIQTERKPRQPGTAKGKIWIASDFNTPLPEDILKSFEGE